MQSNALIKQLKREVKKSPVKASLLAGLFLLACWFWAPLILEMVLPESSSQAAKTEVKVENKTKALVQSTSALPEADPSSKLKKDWKAWVKLIERDPRMQSTLLDQSMEDPFIDSSIAISKTTQLAQAAIKPVVQEISPVDAGLELSSTIIGRNIKLARINQQSYRVGDQIQIATLSQVSIAGEEGFKILAINSHSVVLQRHGKTYTLEVREKQNLENGRIVLKNRS